MERGSRCALRALVLTASAPAGATQVEAHLDRDQAAVGERVTLRSPCRGCGRGAGISALDFAVYPAGTSRNSPS
jgi:hypothetical protein